jgi:hypothetical protein
LSNLEQIKWESEDKSVEYKYALNQQVIKASGPVGKPGI